MSGLYLGVQSKMINPLAEYIACAAHSLSFVRTCAAEPVTEPVDFFSYLQAKSMDALNKFALYVGFV